MKFSKHAKILAIILITAILISIPISAFFGSADVSISDVFDVIKYKLGIGEKAAGKNFIVIVWNLRLPRVLLAISVGCGLSVSGVTMQSITRNVMAEPYTLGVSSGASLMAAFYITRLEGIVPLPFGVDVSAFIGAVLAMIFVYGFASRKDYASNYKLILTGIIVGMIFAAFKELLVATCANPNKVNSVVLWEMGGFGSARWNNILIPVVVSIVGSIMLICLSDQLNLISVGEQTATSMGVSIKNLQRASILLISMITGIMVAASGIISFVGLIIPHIVRRIVGADHKKVLPLSALFGAFFMIWIDVIARVIIAPQELAVSVLTSVFGGPLLLLLIRRRKS